MHSSNERGQQQKYQILIKQKREGRSKGKLFFDWQKAELSLLEVINKHKLNKVTILQQLNQLQGHYIQRNIPPFYSYYTTYAILNCDNPEKQLQKEINETMNSTNKFQDIVVSITLMENLMKEFQDNSITQEAQIKIKNSIIVSIMKVNQWQKAVAQVAKCPVFFWHRQQPFLIHFKSKNLLQMNKQEQDQVTSECIKILNRAKAKQLEIVLNPPFFVKIQSDHVVSQPIQKAKASISPFSARLSSKILLDQSKRYTLPQEELQIIRKFRSMNPRKKETLRQKPLLTEGSIDQKIKGKLDCLRLKIKNQNQRSRLKFNEEALRPAPRSIRLILQKQVNLNNDYPFPSPRMILDSLDQLKKSNKEVSARKDFQVTQSVNKSAQKYNLIHKIRKDSELLLQSKRSKQVELDKKNESLKHIKEQLMRKVAEKQTENPIFNLILKAPKLSNKTSSTKIFPSSQLVNKALDKQKIKIEQERLQLQQKKKKAMELSIFHEKQLEQRQHSRLLIEEKLHSKKDQVEKLNQLLQKSKRQPFHPEEKDTKQEIANLKLKKQLEYQYQKQHIQQIQRSLRYNIQIESLRTQQLQREKQQQEQIMKQAYQQQLLKIKKEFEGQQALMKSQIELQESKSQEYAKRIQEEEQRYEEMQKQAKQWQEKQQQLLRLLQIEEQKLKAQQQHLLSQKQKILKEQLKLFEQKQNAVIECFKTVNSDLDRQLQMIKLRNESLQSELIGKV